MGFGEFILNWPPDVYATTNVSPNVRLGLLLQEIGGINNFAYLNSVSLLSVVPLLFDINVIYLLLLNFCQLHIHIYPTLLFYLCNLILYQS